MLRQIPIGFASQAQSTTPLMPGDPKITQGYFSKPLSRLENVLQGDLATTFCTKAPETAKRLIYEKSCEVLDRTKECLKDVATKVRQFDNLIKVNSNSTKHDWAIGMADLQVGYETAVKLDRIITDYVMVLNHTKTHFAQKDDADSQQVAQYCSELTT